MYYAPILITTLDRHEHFKRLIESLQVNLYAKYTDLYVGLDYPPNAKYEEGYRENREFLKNRITGFHSVSIYSHSKNLGASQNAEFLLNVAREKYDRFILTEDDNVFSPCFIEYMDKGLELIKDDPDTVWVCGYSYPVKWKKTEIGFFKEQSFVSGWGFGTYFDRLDCMNDYLSSGIALDSHLKKLSYIRRNSKKNYIYLVGQLYKTGKIVPNDIGYSCYQLLKRKYCLMPAISLVRNEGWDGSGINCPDTTNDLYSQQKISDEKNFYICSGIKTSKDIPHNQENETIINKFYRADIQQYFKSLIKEVILRCRRTKYE